MISVGFCRFHSTFTGDGDCTPSTGGIDPPRSTWVRPTISAEVRDEHEKNGGNATNNDNPADSEPFTALTTTADGLADRLLAATRSTEEKSPRDREFRDLEGGFERDRAAVVSDLWKDRLRQRKSESTPGQGDNQPVGIPLAMIRSLSNNTTIGISNESELDCMGNRSASNPNKSGSLANDARRRQIETSDTDSSR